MTKKHNSKGQRNSGHFASQAERRERGKSLRDLVSRKEQGVWTAAAKKRDPIAVLEESNTGRISELVPIRYGRMMKSPFTFFRGSAALMASDLAQMPDTGIRAQICGDCHLLNFGAFATPERNAIMDISDFDETLPGPWEWDLKRLATSFVLACRGNGFKPAVCTEAAQSAVRSYRESMRKFSEMRTLEVWYSKLDIDAYLAGIKDPDFRKDAAALVEKQKAKSEIAYFFPKVVAQRNGRYLFKDNPPLVYHTDEQRELKFLDVVKDVFKDYRASLSEERQILIDRFELVDVAMKIVGIGSVGTYCAILLLMAKEDDPLILQVKEARSSVLEPYAGKSLHENSGQRVVVGQRTMQAHSDIFLGWTQGPKGRHFYLRQLRDMKMSPVPELWTPQRAVEVAHAMGWILARAHARSGDSALLSGYMGSKDHFDKAIAAFSIAYADQTELDHKVFTQAIRSGRLEAYVER